MLEVIHHRGPDSDGRSSSRFAEIGFKRLSIIDLATGDQPLANEDGTIECFLNGEIYNYMALRKELLGRGHVFQTESDTEVLPHLFEEMGEEMFSKLKGMFSICVIDHRNQTVVLARDQFGIKQMYYVRTPQGVVFASEVKAILGSGFIEPEIDEPSLLPYLTLFYSPEPHTLVKGVKKLPPGSVLKLSAGANMRLVKYYELPTAPRQLGMTKEEAAERLVDLLSESIRQQLQADVPVGISLSGGLDSSAIAYLASCSRTSQDRLAALTIQWPDTDPGEAASSKQLCQRLGISQEIIEPAVGNFEMDLPLLAWISDEPIADPATYSQFCIAQAARERVKVLLSGAGGDELFGGYGRYVLPWKKAAYASFPAFLQRSLRQLGADRWIDDECAEALSAYSNSRLLWHCNAMSNVGGEQEALLRGVLPDSRSPFDNFTKLFTAYRNYDSRNQQMMVDLHSYLPEQVLPMMDRATMAASIEGRVPLLDVPLVEFCFSLAGDTKMGWPAEQKRFFKSVMAKWVPPQILRGKKLGMPSHFSGLMARHPSVIRSLLLGPEAYTKSVLLGDWIESLLTSTDQMKQNFRVLYALVVLEIWHRLFIKERIYDRPTMSLTDLFSIPQTVKCE